MGHATTVPSKASSPSSSASADCRSRLSVGSSSNRRVAPLSSSNKVWNRACCPPKGTRPSVRRPAQAHIGSAPWPPPRVACRGNTRPLGAGSQAGCVPRVRGAGGSGRTNWGAPATPAVRYPSAALAPAGHPRRDGAPAPGPCRRLPTDAGSATCLTRCHQGRRSARRTRSPGRTGPLPPTPAAVVQGR